MKAGVLQMFHRVPVSQASELRSVKDIVTLSCIKYIFN